MEKGIVTESIGVMIFIILVILFMNIMFKQINYSLEIKELVSNSASFDDCLNGIEFVDAGRFNEPTNSERLCVAEYEKRLNYQELRERIVANEG